MTEFLTVQQIRSRKIDLDSTYRLVIAPTLDCNFRCSYCFEKHLKEYMGENVQTRLLELVEHKLEKGKYKKLLVSWYGGEPLLAINVIEKLSEKIIAICKKYTVTYCAYMITNGYLLDNHVIDILKKCQVREIQVTIDGTRTIHNNRRVLLNSSKGGTYDNIIDGAALSSRNGILVDIRVNVDLRNKNDAEQMFAELANRIQERDLIRVYPGKLFCMPSTESKCDNILLQNTEFVDIQLRFNDLSTKYGFRKKKKGLIPQFRAWYCPICTNFILFPQIFIFML